MTYLRIERSGSDRSYVPPDLLFNAEQQRKITQDHRVRGMALVMPLSSYEQAISSHSYVDDYHTLLANHDVPRFLLPPITNAGIEIYRLEQLRELLLSMKNLFCAIDDLEPHIFESSPRLNHYRKQVLSLVREGRIFPEIEQLAKNIRHHGVETVKPALEVLYTSVLSLGNASKRDTTNEDSDLNPISRIERIPNGAKGIRYASEQLRQKFHKWMTNGLRNDYQHYHVLLGKVNEIDIGHIERTSHSLRRFSALGTHSKLISNSLGTVMEIRINDSKLRVYGIEHPYEHHFVITGWSDTNKRQEDFIQQAIEVAHIFKKNLRSDKS